MDETTTALARRAVECKHWRWMPGMQGMWDGSEGRTYRPRIDHSSHTGPWVQHPSARPDLDDPATLGCLLALVREAWALVWDRKGGSTPYAKQLLGGDWAVYCAGSLDYPDGIVATGPTEAAALAAALEAAP